MFSSLLPSAFPAFSAPSILFSFQRSSSNSRCYLQWRFLRFPLLGRKSYSSWIEYGIRDRFLQGCRRGIQESSCRSHGLLQVSIESLETKSEWWIDCLIEVSIPPLSLFQIVRWVKRDSYLPHLEGMPKSRASPAQGCAQEGSSERLCSHPTPEPLD